MPEWLESNRKRPFPFVGPVEPVAGYTSIDECLVDAIITLPSTVPIISTENTEQAVTIEFLGLGTLELLGLYYMDANDLDTLNIDQLYLLPVIGTGIPTVSSSSSTDNPYNAHVAVSDGAIGGGTTLFDSRLNTHEFEYEELADHLVLHWWDDEYSVKVVLWRDSIPEVYWPAEPTIPLTPSCVIIQPAKVSQIVADGVVMDSTVPIILAEGYNCKLTATPNVVVGSETRDIILASFVPGEGLGRLKDCEEPEVFVRRINGVEPNDLGEFNLQGDPCIFFRPYHEGAPDVDPDHDHGLTMFTYCTPCCTCDDMVTTYAAIKGQLDAQQASIVPMLYNARDALSKGIGRFSGIASSVGADEVTAFARVHCMEKYTFAMQLIIMNGTDSNVTANMTFEPQIDDGTIEGFYNTKSGQIVGPNDDWVQLDPGGTWAQYTAQMVVAKQSWRIYQFQVMAIVAKDRQDMVSFVCDFGSDQPAAYTEQETCSVIGLCGEG